MRTEGRTDRQTDIMNFIEAIPLCNNINFFSYVPSYTIIYIKITQLRVTVYITLNCNT